MPAQQSMRGIGGQTAIFHAVTQFDDDGLPITQLLVERGADLAVWAKLWASTSGRMGAGSQLGYQIVGALGYNLSSKFTLRLAYRYMFVDYRSASDAIYKTAMSGGLIGVNYHFK